MLGGVGAGLMVIGNACEADKLIESVTFAVKLYAPAVVGVPEIAPLPASVSPSGNDPLATDHAYGGVPPLAARVCVYAVPAVPEGNDVVVMLGGIGAGLIVICKAREADRFVESVTFAVKLYAPAVVGVPEITPLPASNTPGGSDPLGIDHAYGAVPPVAARVWLYGAPAIPAGNEDVVIVGACAAGATVMVKVLLLVSPWESVRTTRKLD
jgi:hypothetical protein